LGWEDKNHPIGANAKMAIANSNDLVWGQNGSGLVTIIY
jgi:hypothetical protein